MKGFLTSLQNRKIKWISGTRANRQALLKLEEDMLRFYSTQDGREDYQKMLDEENSKKEGNENICHDLITYINQLIHDDSRILEVGCGRGNLFAELRGHISTNQYYGIEVAPHIIELNKQEYPDAHWSVGSAYQIPYEDGKFDICFLHYVLEHLIFIEDALLELLRVIKPGGELVLIFPDFIVQNKVSSQFMGLTPMPTATERLRKGRWLDAIISLYDSRIRIPRYLKNIKEYGPFPVNINPLCLIHPEYIQPDVDALYISSKAEVEVWAVSHGYQVTYPYGIEGMYSGQVFMIIHKPSLT